MTARHDSALADLQRDNAELRRQLDACRAELATRNSEYGERIEHQSATIDVLKAMSASPGDPQPVFDLIVRRARDLCNAAAASLFEFDGELVHFRSIVRDGSYGTPETVEAYTRLFPMVPTRGSISCRAILDRQTIHVRDMASEPGVIADIRNLGYKSQISLPLLRDGAAIGAVVLSSAEIGGFTDSQVALLQTFAKQAVIAIQSAETCRELQARTRDLEESLEYQTATSDVLNVISRSTADVQPVLDTVVETAVRLCDADGSGIAIREGEVYRYVALHATYDISEYFAFMRQRTFAPGRDTTIGRVALEGKVVHIADITADPEYALPESSSIGRIRTNLGVPLVRDGAVVGMLTVYRQRVELFSERQIELLRTFADQAVIAIENARLLTELQARTRDLEESLEYQTATSEVLNVISRSTADVQPVLDTVAETAVRLCGADSAGVYIREGEVYRPVASSFGAAEPELWATMRQRAIVPGRDSVHARVALEGRVVHVEDARADPDYAWPETVASGRRTSLGVPLLREGALLGTIALSRKRVEPFSERQIELVRTFADQAVIAMENARLLGELQARTRDLEESLEYQTATSDVLKIISRSTADVQPVLDTLAETAARLCVADAASIAIREGEVYRYVSSRPPTEFWSIVRQQAVVPGRASIVGRTALEGRVVQIADIRADPDYAQPENVAAGRRTLLGVPLLRENEPVGVIALARQRVEPFTERQIELVRTFADQAVIAMENARLLGELQARTRDLEESLEYQTATSDVLNVISLSTADVQPVLDTVVNTAVRLCGADTGLIAIREGEVYRPVASSFSAAEPEFWAIARQRTMVPGRDSIAGRVALEGRVVHVEDLAADPDFAVPEAVATGRRTQLGVPLLREGAVLGSINLNRKRVEPFTERQIELVRTFADQAVIAMENARLLSELQARTHDLEESLEYQTATSDVLNVISRSTADVQPVLDTVVETAARLCGADSAGVYIREGEVYRPVASSFSAAEPEFWARVRQRTLVPGRSSMTGRVALEGKVVHITDIRADPDFALPETLASGRRTMLGVPLLRDGEPIGVISLSRKRAEPFTERQIKLVRTFADQAVIAMENARLLGELQTRTRDLEESLEYQTATSEVLNVISRSTSDVQPVLDTVTETAARLCGADSATISIREGEFYRFVSASALDAEHWASLRQRTVVPGRQSITGRVALEGRVVQIADIGADPDFALSESVAAGRRTVLGVPLLREGAVLGTINLARKRVEPYTERQIELVRAFADQAVIAIENARLLTELRESLEQQTATAEVLQVINSSPGDLAPVFGSLLEKALRLCEADFGLLIIWDGEQFRRVAFAGSRMS
jgi:GAF domain-containing protein